MSYSSVLYTILRKKTECIVVKTSSSTYSESGKWSSVIVQACLLIATEGSFHIHSLCIAHDDLSSTQAEVASRDANISQLEETCQQLQIQVSSAIFL